MYKYIPYTILFCVVSYIGYTSVYKYLHRNDSKIFTFCDHDTSHKHKVYINHAKYYLSVFISMDNIDEIINHMFKVFLMQRFMSAFDYQVLFVVDLSKLNSGMQNNVIQTVIYYNKHYVKNMVNVSFIDHNHMIKHMKNSVNIMQQSGHFIYNDKIIDQIINGKVKTLRDLNILRDILSTIHIS